VLHLFGAATLEINRILWNAPGLHVLFSAIAAIAADITNMRVIHYDSCRIGKTLGPSYQSEKQASDVLALVQYMVRLMRDFV
jgi:hypothetical protein